MGIAILHNVDSVTNNPTPINSGNPLPIKMVPTVNGGLSVSRFISTAAVQATVVKASAGQLFAIEFFNAGATTVFVRLYNKATAPLATDTPLWSGLVPAGGSLMKTWETGIQFTAGIGFRCTGAIADNDATVLGAASVLGNLSFK